MTRLNLLRADAIPAAGTDTPSAAQKVNLADVGTLLAQFNFAYGSGGTSATFYLQTSLDGGTNWIDIAAVQFTTASAKKLVAIGVGGALTAGYAPGDGALAPDAVVDGIIGDRLRIKRVVVGAYVGSTVTVDLFTRSGVGAPKPLANVAASLPTATTMQNAATANGNGTSLPVAGFATAVLQIKSSPAMSGGTTVNFEASADGGTTWVPIVAHLLGTASSQATTATADGDYRVNVSGLSHVRARISGYSAGTVTILGYSSPLAGTSTAVAVSNTVTVDTELPNAAALTDADANPTVPGVGAYLMGWDTAQWKRLLQINGQLRTAIGSGTTIADAGGQGAQIVDAAGAARPVAAQMVAFNGANTDRWRSNVDATLLASAARTVTTASSDQTNYNGRGVKVVLDMSLVGTGSVTITIQGKDPISGNYYTILAGAAVVTNSTNVYTVYPGAPASANVSANDILPRTWRVNVVANNANSATYSVSASVIL